MKVIVTVGKDIIEMKPSDAFSIQISVALVTLASSIVGFPISGTQILVFAIIGNNKAKGLTFNVEATKKIIWSWIITIPVAMFTTVGIFFLLQWLYPVITAI